MDSEVSQGFQSTREKLQLAMRHRPTQDLCQNVMPSSQQLAWSFPLLDEAKASKSTGLKQVTELQWPDLTDICSATAFAAQMFEQSGATSG